MAEIEMDVDLAASIKFDDQADDDLIDYDIDTTEDNTHDPWPSHRDEQTSSATEHAHSTEEYVGTEPKNIEPERDENFRDTEADHPQDDVVYNHDDVAEASHQKLEVAAEAHHENIPLETERFKIVTVAETQHVVDEIDYEDGDDTATQGSFREPDEKEEQGGGTVAVEDGAAEDVAVKNVADAAAAGSPIAEPANAQPPTEPAGNANVPESVAKEDEDEITWEQEDGEPEAPSCTVETLASETIIEPAKEGSHVHPSTDNSSSYDQVYEKQTNATGSNNEDTTMDGSAEHNSVEYQQDESPSQLEEPVSEEHDFPAITVQYKGDEFPFFSHGKTEGFFSDVSVLDHSMDSVLAGLRAELENEIAARDELVFQVDELGLEFVEATEQKALKTITLRQVLDVFDSLVKNQDPDDSRALYVYLFTRSTAGKRFEFLAKSAAAGRGLDEVIYLFEPPLGREHGHDYDEADEPSETNEATETHESAGDDDENDADDADGATEESEALDDDEGEEEETPEEQPLDAADRYEEEEEEVQEEEEEADEVEDLMGETDDFIADVEETTNQEGGDYSDGAEEEYKDEQLQPVIVEPVSHSDSARADADAEDAPDANYSYDDEDVDADANPFIHLELQESMADDGGELDYEETANVEGGDGSSHQIPVHPMDEFIDSNEPDTSTTNTLADNAEAISALLDIGPVQGLDEVTNEDLAFDDEMPEIDWRDGPEAADEAKDDMSATPSGLSKRPRDGDEQGAEDEQDAKRRRP